MEKSRRHNILRGMAVAADLEALRKSGKGYILVGSKIAVLRDEAVQEGVIILSDNAKPKMFEGTIVAIGQAIRNNPEEYDAQGLEVGQRATFSKYEGALHKVALSGGDSVELEVMHINDLYFVWQGHDVPADEESNDG